MGQWLLGLTLAHSCSLLQRGPGVSEAEVSFKNNHNNRDTWTTYWDSGTAFSHRAAALCRSQGPSAICFQITGPFYSAQSKGTALV